MSMSMNIHRAVTLTAEVQTGSICEWVSLEVTDDHGDVTSIAIHPAPGSTAAALLAQITGTELES